ncbi:MAG: hypothetical protein AAF357_15655 [Verrucomicrobiota bacterium]
MNRFLTPISLPCFVVVAFFAMFTTSGHSETPGWSHLADWLKLPEGMETIGGAHGDLAVSQNGDVYISISGGLKPGIQVYDSEGNFLRLVEGAPEDIHGFVIHEDANGIEYIYGPRLSSGNIIKMTLDGEVVLDIPATAIPDEHWKVHPKTQKKVLRLTACAVAPSGDIFVTDGYSSDLVHRFSPDGSYETTFGGKVEPYLFKTLHKIAIDTRFDPVRIVGASRENGRLVHLSLDGNFLGDVAINLRRPAAIAVKGDLLAIGEIQGRITVLDKEGKMVTHFGTNENKDEIGHNRTEPENWRPKLVHSPHGIAFNSSGDLFVTEYSKYGRILKFERTE